MPGAETLLAACKRHGVKFMLVSGGFTFFTDRLKAELGLDFAFANQLEVENGALSGRVRGPIVDAAAKKRLLIQQREALGLKPEQVLAMGDGANDLQMLAEAGVGIAVHAAGGARPGRHRHQPRRAGPHPEPVPLNTHATGADR